MPPTKRTGHQQKFRLGWENERLASYLLSRISFISQPVSIGDDIGTDFFCTLFERQNIRKREFLLPRRSFAIQVKSSAKKIDVTPKLDYLEDLDSPYLIGVIKRSPVAQLEIYSADLIPVFLAYRGGREEREKDRRKLKLTPCSQWPTSLDNAFIEARGQYQILCPHVTTLKVTDTVDDLGRSTQALLAVCNRARRNIATREVEEHIYNLPFGPSPVIMAGPGSKERFRNNFLLRLAEVFANLKWIRGNRRKEFSSREVQAFERIREALPSIYGADSFEPLRRVYAKLKTDMQKPRSKDHP